MSGELVRVYCRAIFSTKILRWRAGGRRKNKFSCSGAAGSGAELVPGRGAACGAWEGGGGAVWCGLTQRVILIRFWWYILRVVSVILYRCGCVPMTGADLGAGGGGAGGGGEVVPGRLAGGDTPPSMIYVGTIRGFGMQKFFFEFGVPWFCGLNGVNGLNGQEFDVSCWP